MKDSAYKRAWLLLCCPLISLMLCQTFVHSAGVPKPIIGKIVLGVVTDSTTTEREPHPDFPDWMVNEYGLAVTSFEDFSETVIPPVLLRRDADADSGLIKHMEPISFSPDASKLAVRVGANGDRIYVVRDHFKEAVWITRNWHKVPIKNGVAYFNHRPLEWSPDGERLAFVSTVTYSHDGPVKAWLNLFERDSVRTLLETEWISSLAWSPDGNFLCAVIHAGMISRLFRIAVGGGEGVEIFNSTVSVSCPVWSPSGDRLAFLDGAFVWLNDGYDNRKIFNAPWRVGEVFWSKDSSCLAVTDGAGELAIIDQDGKNAWFVTANIKDKWLMREVVWLSERRFAFILGTTNPERVSLYFGDAVTRTLKLVPSGDLVSAELIQVAEGCLYFKVLNYGPWEETDIKFSEDLGGKRRDVECGLYYSGFDMQVVRAAKQTFHVVEAENDWAAYYFPVIWVQR